MDRKTLAVLVVALAAGYWIASGHSAPQRPDRPVVRWIAKAAKNLLWFALIAEPPPGPQPDHHVARIASIGDDGYPIVDHARGW